jgi:hypothetical protein
MKRKPIYCKLTGEVIAEDVHGDGGSCYCVTKDPCAKKRRDR